MNSTAATTNPKSKSELLDIDKLIARLKREDKLTVWISCIAGCFFLAMIVYSFYGTHKSLNEESSWAYYLPELCFLGAFTLFSIPIFKLLFASKSQNYSLPLAEMLERFAKRYRFNWANLRKSFLYFIPGAVMADLGVTIRIILYAPEYTWFTWTSVAIFQFFFLGAVGIGVVIAYLIWRKRQKPLYDNAITLLHGLQSD